MDDKWFRHKLKLVGKNAGDIATEMGRARSNVSHILNGHQRMSLEWARAFATVLNVDLGTVLEKAGVAQGETVAQLRPGFSDSDAAPWKLQSDPRDRALSDALGAGRAGLDIWHVKSAAMALAGYLPGDRMLVDGNAAERCKQGDIVVAQVYDRGRASATTVLRRLEPPVLVSAGLDPGEMRVNVVDGSNVVIRGRVVASWRVL